MVPPAISRCRSSVASASAGGTSTPRIRVRASGSCTACRYSGVWTRRRFCSEAGRGSESRSRLEQARPPGARRGPSRPAAGPSARRRRRAGSGRRRRSGSPAPADGRASGGRPGPARERDHCAPGPLYRRHPGGMARRRTGPQYRAMAGPLYDLLPPGDSAGQRRAARALPRLRRRQGPHALPGAGGGDPRALRGQERHPEHAHRLGEVARRLRPALRLARARAALRLHLPDQGAGQREVDGPLPRARAGERRPLHRRRHRQPRRARPLLHRRGARQHRPARGRGRARWTTW